MPTSSIRDYARGRHERRNRFRPADVAFFISESYKNVALIFCKARYLSFPIYTRVISSSLTSGEVQHAIRLVYIKNRYVVVDPSRWAPTDVFPRKTRPIRYVQYDHFLRSAFGIQPGYPEKPVLPARNMPYNIRLREMCV